MQLGSLVQHPTILHDVQTKVKPYLRIVEGVLKLDPDQEIKDQDAMLLPYFERASFLYSTKSCLYLIQEQEVRRLPILSSFLGVVYGTIVATSLTTFVPLDCFLVNEQDISGMKRQKRLEVLASTFSEACMVGETFLVHSFCTSALNRVHIDLPSWMREHKQLQFWVVQTNGKMWRVTENQIRGHYPPAIFQNMIEEWKRKGSSVFELEAQILEIAHNTLGQRLFEHMFWKLKNMYKKCVTMQTIDYFYPSGRYTYDKATKRWHCVKKVLEQRRKFFVNRTIFVHVQIKKEDVSVHEGLPEEKLLRVRVKDRNRFLDHEKGLAFDHTEVKTGSTLESALACLEPTSHEMEVEILNDSLISGLLYWDTLQALASS